MKTTLLLMIALSMLAACGGGEATDDGTAPDPDEGTGITGIDAFGSDQWVLADGTVDGNALTLIDAHPVTLALTPDGLGGTSACNSYFGSIGADGDTLTISELGSTMMACLDDGVMDLESAFLGALPRVTAAGRSGATLSLTGAGVELNFTALIPSPDAQFEGTDWTLSSLVEGDTVSSVIGTADATLRYEAGAVSGSTGCNRLNGAATVTDGRLVTNGLATTRMACEGVMEQEAFVLAVLEGRPTVSIEGNALTLALDDGRGLTYSAD
jgi:heat shock protein HslJ